MKLSTIIDHIDQGIITLPRFQRGYVWNRTQVRKLIQSLYKDYPIGSLLVWKTSAGHQDVRGELRADLGTYELLLDGQQRVTSLYGIIKDKVPVFSDSNTHAFKNLYFNVDTEEFEFYGKTKMQHNHRWVSVTEMMQRDSGEIIQRFVTDPNLTKYISRITRISSIKSKDLHIELVGSDKDMDTVVDIFNHVNSGGTKLSKGDLALAKICSYWPQAREEMQARLEKWAGTGYHFNLDWMLRCINAVLTGHSDFAELDRHNFRAEDIHNGLQRAEQHVDKALAMFKVRLGLDHSHVLGSPNSLPAIVRFFDKLQTPPDTRTQDRLLYWYIHAMLWGRYSGPVETVIRQDIMAVDDNDDAVAALIERLRFNRGHLAVYAQDFEGSSRGSRFYPFLYLLTRVSDTLDFREGFGIMQGLPGEDHQLELHHIFPKAKLYKHGYQRKEVNALANFTFLFKKTNRYIGDTSPEDYFPKYKSMNADVLASHWIPDNPELWKIENYREFLAARRELLAKAANGFLDQLYHGEIPETEAPTLAPVQIDVPRPSSIASDEEEAALLQVMDWMKDKGLPSGEMGYELPLAENGDTIVLDLAWPNGIQVGFSRKAALLIDETPDTLEIVNHSDYEYFTNVDELKRHVEREILGE